MGNHPAWDELRDARIGLLSRQINLLDNMLLGVLYLEHQLNHDAWWHANWHSEMPTWAVDLHSREFYRFLKGAFIQSQFSSVENALRLFVRTIDPTACGGAYGEFKGVYDWLLVRSQVTQYGALLDLMRCIRNTIHNNGFYSHQNRRDVTITYKSTTMDFKHGHAIEVPWPFLVALASEVGQMSADIIESPVVSSVSEIIDPFADRFPEGHTRGVSFPPFA